MAKLNRRKCRLNSLVSRFMLARSVADFGPFIAAEMQDLWPSLLQVLTTSPLQLQRKNLIVMIVVLCRLFQAGLPSRETSTQTLTVYPRNAANIPGAHGPITDPNSYPEALHDMRVAWNIFRHSEVRRCGRTNIRSIVWRNDLGQHLHEATLVFSLCEEDYNVLIDDWLIPIWLYYALMDELRRSQGPAMLSTTDSGSQASEEWGDPDDTLRADSMRPNVRMSSSALRCDCDAYSSHTSGELYKRMDRNHFTAVDT